jgi:hypothetical protein
MTSVGNSGERALSDACEVSSSSSPPPLQITTSKALKL